MDILYFLKERTRLIRLYYAGADATFAQTLKSIRAGREPFVPRPEDAESGEPPFQSEYDDNVELLEVSGRVCLSMLAASLKLYFAAWKRDLCLALTKADVSTFKANGYVSGFRDLLAREVGIDWGTCPADLALVEQVVLARNREQHPEHITRLAVTHAEADIARHPRPFFMSEFEASLADPVTGEFWMQPSVHVPKEKLSDAITEVEKLCDWLEPLLLAALIRPRPS
ncbi:hypothetical protein FN976_24410 [Caenimonas sedimenti]|uniref:Uncharacterized protein n=1 Tax=Caenimonas sedimenti TaxID=2596921 RepID=A0A562ZHM1_9BURK|nr:hypothetical protein [Caenimonas sedimenti]TWO68082.1 hypothetical protein FN976_24410 [Caenimonas sedimenti]